MSRVRWKYLVAFGIAIVFVGVTIAVLKALESHEVMFPDGTRVVIRKVTYGRDNRFYHRTVRRMIASVAPVDWAWRMIAPNFRSLQPMEVNSCWQSGVPALVVFGEMTTPGEQSRVWEFRAVDRDGEESEALDSEAVDLSLRLAKPGAKSFRGIIGVGQGLKKVPVSVRIYEVGPKRGDRRPLAEIRVQMGK